MQKPARFFSLTLLAACSAVSADLAVVREHYPLGDADAVRIARYCGAQPDDRVLLYIPHEDEATAKRAALLAVATRGKGCLLALEHHGSRRIAFTADGARADFDPNRIYTAAGRTATLARSGNTDAAAADITAGFANHLLHRYLNTPFIVALHNNTDGSTDIRSYQYGLLGSDSAAVFVNPARDPDDYFYTIDAQAFAFFKARGFNAVLQNNAQVRDDGSMSVYAARRGIGYINVEAQHGHIETQAQMLQAVFDYLDTF